MNSCQCNLHHAISAVLDLYELTRVYSDELIRVSVRAPHQFVMYFRTEFLEIWKTIHFWKR